MKKFMFLYEGGDPDWHQKASPEDLQKQMQEWDKWMEQLSSKGQLVSGGDPLHNGGLRLTADGILSDIATAEYKDLVNGYSIVSAESIQAAATIAKDCPVFSDGAVKIQIREILDF